MVTLYAGGDHRPAALAGREFLFANTDAAEAKLACWDEMARGDCQ